MQTLMRWLLLPSFCLCSYGQSVRQVIPLTASSPDRPVLISVAAYKAEPEVILALKALYRINADGTGSRRYSSVTRVQSEAALREAGILSLAYAANSEHVDIDYARVRRADGTVVETEVADALEMPSPVTREAPFYSDQKLKQLPIRSLHVGDTVEWQATIVRTKAEAANESFSSESFVSGVVALDEQIELRAPVSLKLNVWSPTNNPVISTEGSETVYRWKSSQLKATIGAEAEAEAAAKKKHVLTAAEELDERQGKLPDIAWTTFKSWADVGEWYRGLEADRTVPDAAVKAKVLEVTAGKTTQQQKIEAVYSYVSTQFRYIGVAFGIGRYQPHAAATVLENQYGDCKDKHTLLAAMLSALGLHPDAVLVGPGIRFNEAVPSPASFDHLITRVQIDGKTVWLDTTAEVAPYAALQYGVRNKEALVIPDIGSAFLDKTPQTLPFPTLLTFQARGTLDTEGTSVSSLIFSERGDDEILLRSAFRQTAASHYDELVQKMSYGLGYAGTTSHATVSPLEDTHDPIRISYDYKREKSGDWDNYRIIAQLAPVNLPRFDEKTPPLETILLGEPRVETSDAQMALPSGWTAELPEAVHTKCVYASYDLTYRFSKGMLYTQRRLEVLKREVPLADYKNYSRWIDASGFNGETYIQLARPAASKSLDNAIKGEAVIGLPIGPIVNATTQPAVSAPEAANTESEQSLLLQAYTAAQQNDFDRMRPLLEQVKTRKPDAPLLWYLYALSDYKKGDVLTACKDLQHEIELHPDQLPAYKMLVELQIASAQPAAAQVSLAQWISADGDDPAPVIRLTRLLLADEKPTEALQVATAGYERLPAAKKNDSALQLQLGTAQLTAGETQKGRATLVALLQQTEDAGTLNDVAYELALFNQELELDASSTRTALKKLDEETQTWTLDEDPQVLARKSYLLTATWDTMGYILTRQGNYTEAAQYLQAAWRNSPGVVTGEHLGDLALAQGRKADARDAYELAAASASEYDSMGVRKGPDSDQKRVARKQQTLEAQGVKPRVHDPRRALLNLRTFSLGTSRGLNGSQEVKLLMAANQVKRVELVGAHKLENAATRVQGAALPGIFPDASNAQLVRLGYLNCHTGVCELIFEP